MFFFVNFFPGFAQEQKPVKNISIYFTVEKKYIALPVKNGAPKLHLELWVNGINTRFWDMELAEDNPDWYAYMEVDEWKGNQVELRVNNVPASSKVLATVVQTDEGNPA